MTDTVDAVATTTSALFQSQRQREIAAMTIEAGRVEVADLAHRFGVTTETIRRDLSELQSLRIVRRVHGGATPWETTGFEPLISVRNDQHDEEKRRLAAAAVRELPDTGSVIVDSGSTTGRFIDVIPVTTALRFVTNSLLIARSLSERTEADVVVLGGKVRKNTMAMVDTQAVEAVEPLAVDTLFISTDAASAASGLTTPYREEAALKKAMIRAARRVVALVDHSKFGHDQFIRFAEWSDIDVLITNHETDPGQVAQIESTGTTVVLA
jgi:DeoR family transcriptional regulator, fructose operon transcriptional repressor